MKLTAPIYDPDPKQQCLNPRNDVDHYGGSLAESGSILISGVGSRTPSKAYGSATLPESRK